ncbi:hypothetical protein LCGC14_2090760, partial [marine sediment metagenome]
MVTRRWGTAPKVAPAARARKVRAKPPTAYVALAAAAPKIDGALDDAVWAKAWPIRLGRTLDGGANAAQPTEVRLLRDGRKLYVAFRCAEPLVAKINDFEAADTSLISAREMLKGEKDSEMEAWLGEEIAQLTKRKVELEEELHVLMLPKDPNDEKNVIVEIRGGAGGQEAALFGAD